MIALLLLGCSSPESTGTWLESSGFTWAFFNHRLSHLELAVDDANAHASIVGGTSTTNVVTELAPECDPDTCTEFPFVDEADITVGWGSVTSTDATFGAASAELVVDADGESVALSVPLPHRAKGEPTAILRGVAFDTDEALSGGPACYLPKNGWVPTGFGVALEDAVLADDGLSVDLTVSARFGAGPTREEVRACVDAVTDQARVAVRVDVLAVVSTAPARTVGVDRTAAYDFAGASAPGEQPPPDPVALDGDLTGAVVGWSAWAYDFHLEREPGRGAYLRTVDVRVDAASAEANGYASNFSPGTQLSAFDYVFAGTVGVVELDADVRRGAVSETIEVRLADDGSPVVASFPLGG